MKKVTRAIIKNLRHSPARTTLFFLLGLMLIPGVTHAHGSPAWMTQRHTTVPDKPGKSIRGPATDKEKTTISPKNHTRKLSKEVDKLLNGLGARQKGNIIQVSLPGDICFDYNKWSLQKPAEKTLRKLVEVIQSLKVKKILVVGYTDSKGSKAYNLALSLRRANAIKLWLRTKGGLSHAKIITKGLGAANPVAPNTNPDGSDNPKGRAKNRRVEIYISLIEE